MSQEWIINADDFGRSPEINRAVIRAHREGVLNSASLMVAGDAAREAVELARENPSLAVGLHLVVVDGPAVLPQARIPRLVGADGRFPNQPVRLGLRYAFDREARRQLGREIRAQFERFLATGLPLAHVDGHQHMHMHPAVFERMMPMARAFGAKRIRIVRDDRRLARDHAETNGWGDRIATAVFAMLARRARRCDLPSPSHTYGFLRSGRMTEAYVLSLIQHMPPGAEIYFHPTDGPRLDALGPNPGELEVLLSGAVRDALEARRLQLTAEAEASLAQARLHREFPLPAIVKERHVAPVAAK